MRPRVIFDFDGTLSVGHAPVLAYARAVALPGPDFLQAVDDELARFGTGVSRYRDGYDIVAQIARAHGIGTRDLDAAYTASRAAIAAGDVPLTPAPGLAALLRELSPLAGIAVATNAPAAGVAEALRAWGVAGFVDGLHTDVGKPRGLSPIVDDALARGPVLCVGDIVDYDLAPGMELGAATALVGATAQAVTRGGIAGTGLTFAAPNLESLHDDNVDWARAAGKQR